MLKKEGMNVTVELAEEILYFLRKVANIQIQHFLEKNDKKKKDDYKTKNFISLYLKKLKQIYKIRKSLKAEKPKLVGFFILIILPI